MAEPTPPQPRAETADPVALASEMVDMYGSDAGSVATAALEIAKHARAPEQERTWADVCLLLLRGSSFSATA